MRPSPPTSCPQRCTKRAAASLLDDRTQLAGSGDRHPDHLGPGEAAAEPAGAGDDGSLPAGVVHGLPEMLLAVELEEESDVGPRLVDPAPVPRPRGRQP